MSPGNDERRPRAGSGGSSSSSNIHSTRSLGQDRAGARRHDAALRLPPLDVGTRDPWVARAQTLTVPAEMVAADRWAALALARQTERNWQAACRRLEGLARSGAQQRANREHLLRPRPGDYRGRGQHDLGAAA